MNKRQAKKRKRKLLYFVDWKMYIASVISVRILKAEIVAWG